MAYFLIECPPDTPHDTFDHIRRFMGSNIPSPHQFLVYTGTPGDYGLKISVILNDNESLASLYDNVKEITSEIYPDVKPYEAENVILKPGLFKRIFGG